MKTKKTIIILLMLAVVASLFCIQTFATEQPLVVYVTIANGTLVAVQEPTVVTDADKDGKLTVNDALYLVHEARFDGGAAAGYGSEVSAYGFGITKLWGIENGGSYGFYVNNTSVAGLGTEVKNGDYINAYVYSDTSAYSDKYCFFDVNTVNEIQGKEFTLTLSAAGFDENWAPIVTPVSNATILIDGTETSYKTDANGKVTLKIDDAKKCVISAKSATDTLVPPACLATISPDTPQTGDSIIIFVSVFAAVLAAALFMTFRTRKSYEK